MAVLMQGRRSSQAKLRSRVRSQRTGEILLEKFFSAAERLERTPLCDASSKIEEQTGRLYQDLVVIEMAHNLASIS